jgi:hypothetical protein
MRIAIYYCWFDIQPWIWMLRFSDMYLHEPQPRSTVAGTVEAIQLALHYRYNFAVSPNGWRRAFLRCLSRLFSPWSLMSLTTYHRYCIILSGGSCYHPIGSIFHRQCYPSWRSGFINSRLVTCSFSPQSDIDHPYAPYLPNYHLTFLVGSRLDWRGGHCSEGNVSTS